MVTRSTLLPSPARTSSRDSREAMPLHTSVRRKLLLPSHFPPKSRQAPTTRPQKKALSASQIPPPNRGQKKAGAAAYPSSTVAGRWRRQEAGRRPTRARASSRGGVVRQSSRHRALQASSSSISVPWERIRRIRVVGRPSSAFRLTIKQLGMANTWASSP